MILVRLLWLVLVLIAIPGCGGGSSGTDGGASVRFLGIVQDPRGTPVSGARITLLESGDSVTSDTTGHFEVIALRNELYTFEIAVGMLSSQVVLRDADVRGEDFPLVITVDVETGEIRIDQVSVLPIETPTAEPTIRTPSPGVTPRPTATAVANQRSSIGGIVIDQDLEPVSGIDISLVGTTVADQTAADGTFLLRSRVQSGSIELRVVSSGLAGNITIGGLPRKPFRLHLTLRVTERFGAVGGDLEVVVQDRTVSEG